jgi:hypothetical protein
MVNPDAAIDIAFIRAKDVVINHTRGRRRADVLVGLFVLLNGVTGQDHALLKSSGTEVSASGIGGVIMRFFAVWHG